MIPDSVGYTIINIWHKVDFKKLFVYQFKCVGYVRMRFFVYSADDNLLVSQHFYVHAITYWPSVDDGQHIIARIAY